MIIIHKNEGAKIPYEVFGSKLCFDDDLTINLAKREEDWPVHIDVCYDADKQLVIGAAAGRTYVAEIDIPQREYVHAEAAGPTTTDWDDMGVGMEPVPFDIGRVTLTLWAVEEVHHV